MGGVSFVDDIKLLSPTHKGLNKLIYICEQYAAEIDIKFNGAINKHMVYKGRNCVVHHKYVFVNGEKVEFVVTVDLLGHRLSTVDKSSMITAAESRFWKSLIYSWPTLVRAILLLKISFLSSTVDLFMGLHC